MKLFDIIYASVSQRVSALSKVQAHGDVDAFPQLGHWGLHNLYGRFELKVGVRSSNSEIKGQDVPFNGRTGILLPAKRYRSGVPRIPTAALPLPVRHLYLKVPLDLNMQSVGYLFGGRGTNGEHAVCNE